MNTLWRLFWAHSKEILSPTEAVSFGNTSAGVSGVNHSRLNFLAWVVGVCVRRSRVRGRRRVGDIMFGCLVLSFAIAVVVAVLLLIGQ